MNDLSNYEKKGFLRRLFRETFLLSAFTFGGGYVIVGLMRKRFVDGLNWLKEEEMLDIVAIAQSAPGILAVNASILAGYKLRGVAGAVTAMFATILPPLAVISAVTVFYTKIRGNPAVAAVMLALQASVIAIVADAVRSMLRSILKENARVSLFIMAACFLAVAVFKVNAALVVLTVGVLGALVPALKKYRKGGAEK